MLFTGYFCLVIFAASGWIEHVKCSATINVNLINYNNPNHRMSNTRCCEQGLENKNCTKPKGSRGCEICTMECDNLFNITLTWKRENGTKQSLFFVRTGVLAYKDSFYFPSNLTNTQDNPLSSTIDKYKGIFQLEVSSFDDDQKEIDYVDSSRMSFNQSNVPSILHNEVNNVGTFQMTGNVSYINVSIWVQCDQHFYTPTCDVYCEGRDDSSAHFTCNRSTGQKICLPGWSNLTTNCTVRSPLWTSIPPAVSKRVSPSMYTQPYTTYVQHTHSVSPVRSVQVSPSATVQSGSRSIKQSASPSTRSSLEMSNSAISTSKKRSTSSHIRSSATTSPSKYIKGTTSPIVSNSAISNSIKRSTSSHIRSSTTTFPSKSIKGTTSPIRSQPTLSTVQSGGNPTIFTPTRQLTSSFLTSSTVAITEKCGKSKYELDVLFKGEFGNENQKNLNQTLLNSFCRALNAKCFSLELDACPTTTREDHENVIRRNDMTLRNVHINETYYQAQIVFDEEHIPCSKPRISACTEEALLIPNLFTEEMKIEKIEICQSSGKKECQSKQYKNNNNNNKNNNNPGDNWDNNNLIIASAVVGGLLLLAVVVAVILTRMKKKMKVGNVETSNIMEYNSQTESSTSTC